MMKKGFTLVELLVVVTLIAILAVAVLATINPIEQRNKGLDTSAKAAAAELLRAEERFYATYGCYTWDNDGVGDYNCTDTAAFVPAGEPMAVGAPLLIQQLEDVEEVKDVLLTRLTQTTDPWASLAVSEDATNLVHVCFVPVSNSFTQLTDCTIDAACGDPLQSYVCVPDTDI